jgi:hypothetical protein
MDKKINSRFKNPVLPTSFPVRHFTPPMAERFLTATVILVYALSNVNIKKKTTYKSCVTHQFPSKALYSAYGREIHSVVLLIKQFENLSLSN